ncbi:CCA tRNA nucleotidyltransferase [Cyanobium sp. FGCU-6]|nr:CCA tRNA nucleotidyltransferase [Cyanobium sp. FGCU6]
MARRLWRRLEPERWPVPPDAFPAGTALVGGAVRDGLLDRLAEQPDLDLVVGGDAIALTRCLAGRHRGSCVVLDRERSIARLVVQGWTIDLARRVGDDLATDLARRDYSINAIALPLAGADQPRELIDPQGGLADLAAGHLRAIGEANLLDDPLRLLRGLRLAAELGFELESGTAVWIRHHSARCGSVAGERVLAELERLAAVARGGERWLARAVDESLLAPWGAPAPAPPALAGLTPEAAELRGLSPQEAEWALPLARLATVLDGPALAVLRASRRLQQRAAQLRRHWELLETGGATGAGGETDPLARLAEPERLTLQRQLEADLPAWLLRLPIAAARCALQRWRDPSDPLFHPRTPLDGRALQEALGLGAGPELGRLIDHLTQERAFGRLRAAGGSDAQTLTCAQRWLAEREGRHG